MPKKIFVGQEVLHEFQLCVVRKMEGEKVKELARGGILMSGHDLLVFAPSPENRGFAEELGRLYRAMDAAGSGINWPSIHNHFSMQFNQAMQGVIKQEDAIQNVQLLVNEVLAIASLKSQYGFPLLRSNR